MAWKNKGCPLPPASLQLLVPPVRLLSAFIWKVMQQQNVGQYEKVLDFISLATEAVPELLSVGQRAHLLLGLRAKVVLELCRGDGGANLQRIQTHLEKIHTCSSDLSTSDQQAAADILKTSYTNFASLVEKLLNVPFEKEFFFQEVFPANYGSSYDEKLAQLVSEFLSRLEELLPIPDLEQTAGWLSETAQVSKDLELHLSEAFTLNSLLLHHRRLGNLSPPPSSTNEEVLLSTLALPTPPEKFTEPYSEDEDFNNEVERLVFEDLEENSSQSSDVAVDDWMPKKEAGPLSRLFICPQCSFAHRVKRKVQEHILTQHQKRPPLAKSGKKAGTKAQEAHTEPSGQKSKPLQSTAPKKRPREQAASLDKRRERKQKRDNVENKERQRRRRKEAAGEDKRFLSARQLSKNFSEEETTCPTCSKVFEHPNQLKTHAKLHAFPFHCAQCEKGFGSPSGYYQHQRLHKRGRVFTCRRCGKGFLCNYSLRQHERLHEGPASLCTVCGKSFSKAGIVRHMQMHKGEKNYLCTSCGKSFLSSGELLLHTRSHTGETPYTCTRCGKGFSSKSHLNVHTRSHTGERPYLCAECPKRFLTLNCLKRHALSHNGLKPFRCPKCEREFSQQGNLKRHLATHKPNT